MVSISVLLSRIFRLTCTQLWVYRLLERSGDVKTKLIIERFPVSDRKGEFQAALHNYYIVIQENCINIPCTSWLNCSAAEAFSKSTDQQPIVENIESIKNRQRIQKLVLEGRNGTPESSPKSYLNDGSCRSSPHPQGGRVLTPPSSSASSLSPSNQSYHPANTAAVPSPSYRQCHLQQSLTDHRSINGGPGVSKLIDSEEMDLSDEGDHFSSQSNGSSQLMNGNSTHDDEEMDIDAPSNRRQMWWK
ncbi:hypothetical protein Btru_074074 [Bulinus truncatus]|nr:hypothetical protein Btru_074074 [Bulinus truncatus]